MFGKRSHSRFRRKKPSKHKASRRSLKQPVKFGRVEHAGIHRFRRVYNRTTPASTGYSVRTRTASFKASSSNARSGYTRASSTHPLLPRQSSPAALCHFGSSGLQVRALLGANQRPEPIPGRFWTSINHQYFYLSSSFSSSLFEFVIARF